MILDGVCYSVILFGKVILSLGENLVISTSTFVSGHL